MAQALHEECDVSVHPHLTMTPGWGAIVTANQLRDVRRGDDTSDDLWPPPYGNLVPERRPPATLHVIVVERIDGTRDWARYTVLDPTTGLLSDIHVTSVDPHRAVFAAFPPGGER